MTIFEARTRLFFLRSKAGGLTEAEKEEGIRLWLYIGVLEAIGVETEEDLKNVFSQEQLDGKQSFFK
ncbi:MAG: hypothetical protein HXX20_24035 [Chloroflexi bacterium]|nr:hypothetical protein [Chloroflexota bacterium]